MKTLITTLVFATLFTALDSAQCLPKPVINDVYQLYTTSCCRAPQVTRKFHGKPAQKPRSFHLTKFLRNNKFGFRLKWNTNVTNLKGFRLEFENLRTAKNICRVLDYSNFFLNNHSTRTKAFRFELHPVRVNERFLVHLNSLPDSTSNNLAPLNADTIVCREWVYSIRYNLEDDKLKVEFPPGPASCNIVSYEVSLMVDNTTFVKTLVNHSQTAPRLSHTFHKLCPGVYKATVEIFDKHWNVAGQCICSDRSGNCGIGCFRSMTNPFTVKNSVCQPTTKTIVEAPRNVEHKKRDRSSQQQLTIFLAVIGAMIGMLLVLCFSCFRRSPPVKRGLLFYTEDHCYHCAAVGQFISFLKKSRCQVKTAASLPKDDIPLRLSLEIQKADFVILIYSKALHQRLQAWKSNQDYVEFLKEDNSAVLTLPLLKELKSNNKLILCKFAKIPNSAIDCEFSSTKCYTLMKELNSLLKKIHGKGLDKELSMFLKSNVFNNHSNSLEDKIKVAEQFEENNSNWFTDKYMCPKKMDSLNEKFDQLEIFQEGFEPSIYSVPISHMLADINENNDVRV
ncbi:uncharacterized protein LOC115217573 [Argonauta hians]